MLNSHTQQIDILIKLSYLSVIALGCIIAITTSKSPHTTAVNINFTMISLTVGVLALQGGFSEHIDLVRKAAEYLSSTEGVSKAKFHCIEVRTKEQLDQCNALIIPGGESTTISFVAAQSGLLEPLRDFVKYAVLFLQSRKVKDAHMLM